MHGPSFQNIVLVLVRALLGDFDLSETPFKISDPIFELGVHILMYVYVLFMIILMMVSQPSERVPLFSPSCRNISCAKGRTIHCV